jgi:LCP family protein required for cell wall assembly
MINKFRFKKSNRASGADGAIEVQTVKAPASKRAGGFMMSFWITFLAAFIVLSLALIPAVGAFMEFRPFGTTEAEADETGEETELVILEEDFTDYFIPSNSPFYAAFKDKKRVNCMLLGVNQGLTDVIMLVSFDVDARHADIISIPRDTYYYRSGYSDPAQFKINAAYRKDPLNTAKAVSEILLGIPINYYAVIEYEGVEKIVDAMGGVPVEIPEGFVDRRNDINLKSGLQTLNGEDAVKFLRMRHIYPSADIGRIKAQHEFMKAAFKKALQSDLPKLAATVRENVTSDMPMSKMVYLAQKALGMSADRISAYTMPYTATSPYVYPDVDKIDEMIREIYSVPLEDEPLPEDEAGEPGGDSAGNAAKENAAEEGE